MDRAGQFDPEAATEIPGRPSEASVGASGEEATLASELGAAPRGRLRRGQAVGRFIVVDPLGAGAMGEVVAAYDPDLHRRVAIKVLRVPGTAGAPTDAATERMLREARALAQLAHPNVITVFEVDRLEQGELFIAMEFVDGGTLRQWAKAKGHPRSWREVVEVYVQAAEGLAGAHAVGMVHRDFKPDNVLIGTDGRVRVTDFGLVGVDPRFSSASGSSSESGEASPPSLSGSGSGSAADALVEATLTRTGTIMGTPAYMAPEQERGRADARSDQFAFCVSLYETLYGERPYAGDTLVLLRTNVAAGRIRAEPGGSGVPAWVREVVLRGLAVSPDERWPDMSSLARALQRDPAARRGQWFGRGAAVVAVAGFAAWAAFGRDDTVDPCASVGDRITSVWNAERGATLRAAFVAAADDAGIAAHDAFAGALDAFSERWVAARRDACEANKVRAEQSDRTFDRRMRCLDRRLEGADALVSVYEHPTADTLAKIDAAVDAIPGLDRCADAEALEAEIPPPEDPAVREVWSRLHRDLDRADALGVAGNEIASLALYESLGPEVEAIGHPPLTARLVLNYGNALVRQERWTEAVAVLESGPETAAQSGDAVVEAKMWLLLAKATGFGLNDAKSGATMARAASVAAVRAGDDPDLRVGIEYTASLLRDADGDFEAAVEYAQRSVALAVQAYGENHRTTSTLYGNLGVLLDHAGKYPEAMEAHRTSLRIDTALHGPEHPDVAHSLVNIGLLLQNQGEYEQADAEFARALAIYDETVGRKHGAYATALLDRAQNAAYWLRFDQALAGFTEVLELYRQTRPEDHADIATAHQNLGAVYLNLHRPEEAEEHFREAYRIRTKVFGPDHPSVMHALNAIAQLIAQRGDLEQAEAELRKAVEAGERGLPPGHPDLAYPLQSLGHVLEAQERYEEAIPYLERAVRLRAEINPNLRGRSEFALARSLYFVDRPRAEKLLDEAASKVDELGRSEIAQFREMVKR